MNDQEKLQAIIDSLPRISDTLRESLPRVRSGELKLRDIQKLFDDTIDTYAEYNRQLAEISLGFDSGTFQLIASEFTKAYNDVVAAENEIIKAYNSIRPTAAQNVDMYKNIYGIDPTAVYDKSFEVELPDEVISQNFSLGDYKSLITEKVDPKDFIKDRVSTIIESQLESIQEDVENDPDFMDADPDKVEKEISSRVTKLFNSVLDQVSSNFDEAFYKIHQVFQGNLELVNAYYQAFNSSDFDGYLRQDDRLGDIRETQIKKLGKLNIDAPRDIEVDQIYAPLSKQVEDYQLNKLSIALKQIVTQYEQAIEDSADQDDKIIRAVKKRYKKLVTTLDSGVPKAIQKLLEDESLDQRLGLSPLNAYQKQIAINQIAPVESSEDLDDLSLDLSLEETQSENQDLEDETSKNDKRIRELRSSLSVSGKSLEEITSVLNELEQLGKPYRALSQQIANTAAYINSLTEQDAELAQNAVKTKRAETITPASIQALLVQQKKDAKELAELENTRFARTTRIDTAFQRRIIEVDNKKANEEFSNQYANLISELDSAFKSGNPQVVRDVYVKLGRLNAEIDKWVKEIKERELDPNQVNLQISKLYQKNLSASKLAQEAQSLGGDSQQISILKNAYDQASGNVLQLLQNKSTTKSQLQSAMTSLESSFVNLNNYATELKQSFRETEDPVEQIQQRLKMIDTIISGIDSAINTVLSALKAGLNVVHKTITTLGKAIAAIPRTLTRIVQLFGNLGNRVRSVNALTNAWVVLDSKLNLIERAYNAIFSNQYLTNVQQTLGGIAGLNQISGETANTIIDFAKAMEYAFGTPMSTMISQTSELALLMRSLGVQTENIANASLMISTVGLSLQASGILGGDYDAIMTKIVSGLRGETEAIADVGIDVRAKTLDDLLAKIKQSPEAFGLTADAVSNLANSTSQLSEKQLVNLRILAIYNQYVQNNGELLRNYAGYMDTVVGRVNGLKSAFTTLFSTVGVVIYQVVAAIGPYLEYIIRLITSAVSALAKLLGFETDWSELSGQMSGSFDSQTGSIQDNTEATEENTAAKNSNKGALASFDRITSIDSTSGSDSGSDSEADLSGLLSGLPNMNDLLDQYLNGDSRMDALEEKWNSMLDSMKNKFQQFASDITGHQVDITFGFNSKQFNDGIALAWDSIKRTLNTIGETITYYSIRIAEDLQIGKLSSGAVEGLGNITKALADVLEIMQPIAELFYETFLSPIFKSAGESLYEWLTAGSEEFSNQWVASAESLAERLTEAMQSDNPWENFLGVISEEFPLLGNLITLIESVSKAIGSVWETISPLIGEFGQFAQDTIIPYLADTFERMATYIDENRESIQELLRALGEFAWDIVTTAIEGIGKLIDTVVTNKDLVMELLDGFSAAFKFVIDHPEIIALLIGGKAATTVAGGALGAAGTGLDIFSSLQGLGIIGGSGAGAAGAGAAAGGIGSIASALPVIGIVFGAILALVTALSNNEELVTQFSETFNNLFNSIGEGLERLQPLFEFLAQVITVIGTVIGGAVLGLVSFVTAIQDLVNDVLDIATMFGDMIKSILNGDGETFVSIVSSIFNKILAIAYDFASLIVTPIASFVDSIISLINMIPGVDVKYSARDAWGSLDPDAHAEGGIFSHPHYALFAEDGAEAVIPLSNKYRSEALPIFMQTASILGFNLRDAITSQTSITSIPSIGSVQLPQIDTGLDKQDPSGPDSIRDGIEEALFSVINQLISQGYLTKGGANNYTANSDSVLRMLARLLAPYLTAQTSNISNSGFTIR